MRVKYEGPSDEVRLVDGIVAKRGESVEVDDELGKSLLEQAVWKGMGGSSKKESDS